MTDTLNPAQRHRCMAAIHGKNTKPELVVRSVLYRLGYRFRLHYTTLPGCPDIVLPRWNSVIFVHGCFWHSHKCSRGQSTPASNAAFWRKKRNTNKLRDRRNLAALRRSGWRVFVVWECQTSDFTKLANRLSSFLIKSAKKRH